ncbi:MAG: hypothetical protein JW850_10445 [Thermoflexales bacterium]|nr:hypothetical protein [Thermoflexales bacterium]
MSETLSDLRCPGCNAPGLIDMNDGALVCQYCGSRFAQPERVCPHCSTLSEVDDLDCPGCGQALRGLCPACNTPNLLQAKLCRRCGVPLDLLSSVLDRQFASPAGLIYERGEAARALKQQEEQASRQRLANMWQQNQEREQWLSASRARQQQEEQRLIKLAMALFAIVVVVALVSVLLIVVWS